jgi:hemolysin activation/secretion protein
MVAGAALLSQVASGAAPNAGSILQQVEPETAPSLSPGRPALTVEGEGAGQAQAGIAFRVSAIRISGNTVFDTVTLHALVADAEGRTLTLAQLNEQIGRITRYYREHGHPLAQAFIPAQRIEGGVVSVEVIEARYGQIELDNSSRVRISLLDSAVSLQSGTAVEQSELDQALLLLSDIPGVVVNATLRAGELVGTSNLRISVTPDPEIRGNLVLDGYGNPYTGRARVGGTLEMLNPLRFGDVLSLAALSSGSDLNYGRIVYESMLNGRGTRLGASYSALHYQLGDALESLDAHGTAQVQSVWMKHTLVRSQTVNLYAEIQYEALQLRDRIDTASIRTDRHLSNWTAGIAGDTRDSLLDGAVSAWSVRWTAGRVRFHDTNAAMLAAATARSEGGFAKGNAAFMRLQALGDGNALYMAFTGQWADGNLDASDKMIGGGSNAVRAYDVGAISGDSGYLATLEYRHDLGEWWSARWQAVGFVDHARLTINQNKWASGANRVQLSGAGAGISVAGARQWSGRAYVAAPFGASPAGQGASRSTRAWIEVAKSF